MLDPVQPWEFENGLFDVVVLEKMAPKCTHVQHAYFSSFSQLRHWFVALLIPLAWWYVVSLSAAHLMCNEWCCRVAMRFLLFTLISLPFSDFPHFALSPLPNLPFKVFTATVVLGNLASTYRLLLPCLRNKMDRLWTFSLGLFRELNSAIPIASALMTCAKHPDPSASPRVSLSSGNSQIGSYGRRSRCSCRERSGSSWNSNQ